MKIAVTGGTGFIGRYILRHLVGLGNRLKCWRRPSSDTSGLDDLQSSIEWIEGDLGDDAAAHSLVADCDAVVHGALYRQGSGFRGAEGNIVEFAQKNIAGTLQLIEAAKHAGAGRFVFISSCSVHEKILSGRPLDETHPLWSTSHYGAHKGAIEQFVHSYGLGEGYGICAVRPCGVYGLDRPPQKSKWFDLVRDVVAGKDVHCDRGGKEVHAADVAKAVALLLEAPAEAIKGEAFSCCNMYISDWDVAQLAKEISGSSATIHGWRTSPKNQIVTDKIKRLGMKFGGDALLRSTIEQLVAAVNAESK